MQTKYVAKKFQPAALATIARANQICADYQAQGYDLTLRQLYYQFVSKGWIANKQTEYKRLGAIINDARMAGLLDWDYIVDRTRNLRSMPSWNSPASIISSAARSFAIDKWADQPSRVEVWIEKDALVGVIEPVCNAEQVSYFSCRGYTSQSEIWGAAQRIGKYLRKGQDVTIVHLGDHDPSGIDMTRDIEDRLRLFTGKDNLDDALDEHRPVLEKMFADTGTINGKDLKEKDPEGWSDFMGLVNGTLGGYGTLTVNRIALNMDQILQYDPPPNPAKFTDSRAAGYVAEHGDESWELDALEPTVLGDLITAAIDEVRDADLWDDATGREDEQREVLTAISANWADVAAYVGSL